MPRGWRRGFIGLLALAGAVLFPAGLSAQTRSVVAERFDVQLRIGSDGAPEVVERQALRFYGTSRCFSGYINWDEGILYSAEAAALREAGRCPNCGGALALAGRGVIRCPHCGTEIFLA